MSRRAMRSLSIALAVALSACCAQAAQKDESKPRACHRCLLEVDGHRYINGSCEVQADEVSTQVTDRRSKTTHPQWAAIFVQVDREVDQDGNTGERGHLASWTGPEPAGHAHAPLGAMTRKGSCYSNKRAKVCGCF